MISNVLYVIITESVIVHIQVKPGVPHVLMGVSYGEIPVKGLILREKRNRIKILINPEYLAL